MQENFYSVPEPYRAARSRYDSHPYRRCGYSGIKLSALSLGFWHNFGGFDGFEKARAVARAAFDSGINCFDLANNYGPPYGSAEECFGKMMTADFAPYRDELFISTKAGYDMWPGPFGKGGSRKYLLTSLEQSLKRMNLSYVDVFYHHCMDAETPLEESMYALVQAVKSGKALYAGLSNYTPEQARNAIKLLGEEKVPCLIEQSSYSMLNRNIEHEGLLDTLRECGVGFAAYSPLAQGLLSGKYNGGIPENSRAAGTSKFLNASQMDSGKLEKVARLGELAKKRGQALAQFALSWLLHNPQVSTVIIGVSNVPQLTQNLKCIEKCVFTEQELLEVASILQ